MSGVQTGARLDELFRMLDKHGAEIVSQGEHLAQWRKWVTIRGLRNAVLWFLLPFGVMWGAGADPVTAARFAVVPSLLMGAMATCVGAVFAAVQAVHNEGLKSKVEAVRVAADALKVASS